MDHPSTPSPSTPWVWVGMVSSTASGLVAWAATMPPAFWTSLAGIAGSVLLPVLKARIDANLARVRAELEVIRADRDSARKAESDLRSMLLMLSAPVPPDPVRAAIDAEKDPVSPGRPGDGRGPEALRAPSLATHG